MNLITAKKLSLAFALTFFAVGCLGFLPNPLVSARGLFAVNAAHNAVHLLTAAAFLAGATFPEPMSQKILRWIAIGYAAVAVLGFFTESEYLLGLVRINEPDRWLHAALALAILSASFFVSPRSAKRSVEGV